MDLPLHPYDLRFYVHLVHTSCTCLSVLKQVWLSPAQLQLGFQEVPPAELRLGASPWPEKGAVMTPVVNVMFETA